MKKKTRNKIISILLCFMCLFFVGCGDGGPDDDLEDEFYSSSLDGVKVLSRPANYNFGDAVGEYSEYYYNLFSAEILKALHNTYGDYSNIEDIWKKIATELIVIDEVESFKSYDKNGNELNSGFSDDNNKYYLYDSIRYKITKVITNYDESGIITGQQLVLDLNSGWNWNIKYNANDNDDTKLEKIIFLNLPENYGVGTPSPNINNTLIIDLTTSFQNEDLIETWTEVYSKTTTPSFSEVYVGTQVPVEGEITNYWKSPYYEKYVENANVTTKNFYQDALEYVTYLFVLGYDYVDEDGKATADALKFDLDIEFGADGFVKNITIGGGISISQALDDIKEEYAEAGNFVGLTDTNKKQIKRFILERVIGENAYTADDEKTTTINESIDVVKMITNNNGTTSTQELKFNRNYDKIVENIINYACSQAPIGKDGDKEVTLDDSYLASEITDYEGEYFFLADGADDDGNSVDNFRYISAAEYQSMVFFPIDDDIGKRLTDVHLGFEYYDYAETLALGLKCNETDGLNLMVGLRYFDCETGTYTFNQAVPFNIKYGIDAELSEQFDPDYNTVTFTEDDMEGDVVKIEEPFTIDTKFRNPLEITPAGDGEKKSTLITGNNEAREFYQINDSESGVGFFGALNPEKFKKYNADGSENPNACDYLEVYFDIQKEKGVRNVNYNFKVGLKVYYTMGEDD